MKSLRLPLTLAHGNIQGVQGRAGDASVGVKEGIKKKAQGKKLFHQKKGFISSTAQTAPWFL